MKKWFVVILAGMLLAAGCNSAVPSAPAGGQPNPAVTQPRVRMDDVTTIRISGFIGFPPQSDQPPKPLQASNPDDRATIAKLVAWINAAQPIAGEVSTLARRETDLVVELNDGRRVTFRPATDCTTEPRANGTATHCTGAPGQVVFDPASGQAAARLLAPDLAKWLGGGWEADLPRQSAQATQDIWVVPPVDLLAGRVGAGHHYTLHPLADVLRVSPDGKRALLEVPDTSHARVTYPEWIEVLDLATGQRQRLALHSDWWQVADWLPDGRIVLVGEKVWLCDQRDGTLSDLGATDYPLGGAFDGRSQVAWTRPIRTVDGTMTATYTVIVFNLETRKRTEYPGPYHKALNPHAGAPLVFSPAGEQLAFMDRIENGPQLLVLNLTSGAQRSIVGGESDPALWGQHGLWVRRRSAPPTDDWSLIRLDAQGRAVQTVSVTYPTGLVSPDQRWLPVFRYDDHSVTEPGLLKLDTGTVHWANLKGYYASGWTPTGELVLMQEHH